MEKAYEIIIFPLSLGDYTVVAPDFPGCFSIENTPAAAVRFVQDWIVQEYLRTGELPDPMPVECRSPKHIVHHIVVRDK